MVLTGFGYGGALSTVLAPWVALQFPTADVRCVTFGAPRVGNGAFASVLWITCAYSYRVVVEGDPLPQVGGWAGRWVRRWVVVVVEGAPLPRWVFG